jgi:hypothetical protein
MRKTTLRSPYRKKYLTPENILRRRQYARTLAEEMATLYQVEAAPWCDLLARLVADDARYLLTPELQKEAAQGIHRFKTTMIAWLNKIARTDLFFRVDSLIEPCPEPINSTMRPKGRHLSEEEHTQVLHLRNEGMSYTNIGNLLQISHSTARLHYLEENR